MAEFPFELPATHHKYFFLHFFPSHAMKLWLPGQLNDLASLLRFGLIGVSGMIPDFATFSLLLLWLPLPLARAAAIWVAMTWNFWLHRHLTFPGARSASLMRQYMLFCGSSVVGAILSWSCSIALCATVEFFARNPLAAAVVGVGAGFTLNYVLSRTVVFLPDIPSTALATECGEATEAVASDLMHVPSLTSSGRSAP